MSQAEKPITTSPSRRALLALEYLDRPLPGWFALTVCREEECKRDWVALMVDVHPDELKNCVCKIAFLFVHPNDYHPDGSRTAREAWVRIPGKHRSEDAAWAALEDMMNTRH